MVPGLAWLEGEQMTKQATNKTYRTVSKWESVTLGDAVAFGFALGMLIFWGVWIVGL